MSDGGEGAGEGGQGAAGGVAAAAIDPRDELLRLVRRAKEQVSWLERGGVVGLPRGTAGRSRAGGRAKANANANAKANENANANANANAQASRNENANENANANAQASRNENANANANENENENANANENAKASATSLAQVREALGDCTRCKLSAGRSNLVFGVGDPEAALVFVGEGPGAEEDRTGEPFVGAAGQLLTKMIVAMGYAREQVYICNIVKCRPPGNRNPEPDEIAACEPFLQQQLGAIRPRMIVGLGKFAAQCLLRSDAPISKLRGRFHAYEGIPFMPTFHPAYLLRNPSAKREVWSDLQQVMAELDRLGIPRPGA